MSKKIVKYLFAFVAMFFATVTSSFAIEMSVDDLWTEIDEIDPNADYAYVIGNYAYTSSYILDTKDLMLAARSIDVEDTDGKTKNDPIFNEMSVPLIRKIYDDNFEMAGWERGKNFVGTVQVKDVVDIDYINYQKITEKETFTITYRVDGQEVAMDEVKDGGKITEPLAAEEREGYKFVGWYKGNEEFDFNSTIKGNVVLDAKYLNYTNIDEIVNFEAYSLYMMNQDDHRMTLDGNVLKYYIYDLDEFSSINIAGIENVILA